MNELYLALAAFLIGNILIGGFRIALGPTKTDRLLAMQFLTTTTVAIFLILAEAFPHTPLRSLSLVFVGLATLTTIAFVQIYSKPKLESRE